MYYTNNWGFKPWSPKLKPVIGKVLPDSAALAAGLRQGDLIVSADGTVMNDWMQWVGTVKSHPGVAINLIIERDDVQLPITITRKVCKLNKKQKARLVRLFLFRKS